MINTCESPTAHSAFSTRLLRGASHVFFEPVLDLERTRSRPKLVAALIGIIALSGACMSENIRAVPSAASPAEVLRGEGGAVDAQAQEAGAMRVHVATAG